MGVVPLGGGGILWTVSVELVWCKVYRCSSGKDENRSQTLHG